MTERKRNFSETAERPGKTALTEEPDHKRSVKPELLSPAGSMEAMRAAYKAGADAVYIGGRAFGARAYADNPDEKELLEAIDLSHILGKKLYLTVNTLIKNEELEEKLVSFLEPYYRQGLDGVIVQDTGAALLFRKIFPGMELHASTQLSVTGPYSAKLLKESGFCRVVPARELSLSEIRTIYDATGMEIECFIHGAMCYSYSGMCLMSSMIGGRSGNRGRCAGICRLPFSVWENGKRMNTEKSGFPLNMKDMCAIDLIPEMIRAGIVSFKIEGRMKRPEYTAGVTSIYRKYIDRYWENPDLPYTVETEDREKLAVLFNRDGFNRGYYRERNGRDMIALSNRKLSGREEGSRAEDAKILYDGISGRLASERLSADVSGVLKLSAGEPASLTLMHGKEQVSVEGMPVQPAKKQPMSRERMESQIRKTGGSHLHIKTLEIQEQDPSGRGLFIPVSALNQLRRDACNRMEKAVTESFHRNTGSDSPRKCIRQLEAAGRPDQSLFSRSGKPVKHPGETEQNREDDVYYTAHCRNLSQARGLLRESRGKIREVGFPIRELEEGSALARQYGCGLRVLLPYIVRAEEEEKLADRIRAFRNRADVFVARSLEGAALLLNLLPGEKILLDQSVYTMNDLAQAYFAGLGIRKNTISLELNRREILRRDSAESELILYGRAPVMVSAQCLEKTVNRCTRSNAQLVLTDRKRAAFPAVCECGSCYNVIYNSLPTSLHDEDYRRIGAASCRLEMTVESEDEAAEVGRVFFQNAHPAQGSFTRGHFRRGVL